MQHDSDEFRRAAEGNTILRCVVGSSVHGLAVGAQDDRDEMGICIEPPEYVIGLKRFEQYEYRSARARTGTHDPRSGPGDLDLVIYSLRKWMRLALDGNPTVLLPLFAPPESLIELSHDGLSLMTNAHRIVSDQAGHRFLGYLRAQRDRLEGRGRGTHTNRPELIEQYGFDTKFAGHMVRLALQGRELLRDGTITLPMPQPWRQWIVDLRTGKHSKTEALAVAHTMEMEIEHMLKHGTSVLREHPDRDWANQWMITTYQYHWRR